MVQLLDDMVAVVDLLGRLVVTVHCDYHLYPLSSTGRQIAK